VKTISPSSPPVSVKFPITPGATWRGAILARSEQKVWFPYFLPKAVLVLAFWRFFRVMGLLLALFGGLGLASGCCVSSQVI